MRPSGGDGEPYKVEKLKIIWKLNSRKDVFINKEWIDKWSNFQENIVVLVRSLTLQYSEWVFSEILTYGWPKTPPSLEPVTQILKWWNLEQLYPT